MLKFAAVLVLICVLLFVRKTFKISIAFKKYQLRFLNEFLRYAGGWTNVCHISFTKRADGNSLRQAVREAVYQGNVNALVFENLTPQNFSNDVFEPFFFACLDFSRIEYIDHRYSHLDTISGATPCSTLILPKGLSGHIHFWEYCPELEALVIPSQTLVLAYVDPYCQASSRSYPSIHVHSGFRVYVPEHLLDAYRSEKTWGNLIFVDENGEIISPEFSPYYGS